MSAVSSSKPRESVSAFHFPKKSRLATEVDQLARQSLKRKNPFGDQNGAPKEPKISATKPNSSPVPLATTTAAASTAAADDADLLELALHAYEAYTLLRELDGAQFTFPKIVKIAFSSNLFNSDHQPYIQAVLTWASEKLAGGTFSRNQICEMFVNDMRKEMEGVREDKLYEGMVILLAMFEYPFVQCAKRTNSSVAAAQTRTEISVPLNKSIDHLTKALSVYRELTEKIFSCEKTSEIKFKFPDKKELATRLERFVSYEAGKKKSWSKFVRDWALNTLAGGAFDRNQICEMLVESVRSTVKLSENPRVYYELTLILLAMFELPLLNCANPPASAATAATTAAAASK